ncbi:cytochrome b5-like heme/steroid binding domain-containing protein [Powellomyces hirtus]|nr:cytochrome b5-like heme/steroid binding domain-containing protein [Powellomyces hirtus]
MSTAEVSPNGLQQRKRTAETTSATRTLEQRKQSPSATDLDPTQSVGFTCLLVIASLIITTIITSLIITNSFTFGYDVPNWRKYAYRQPIALTTEELRQYDGKDPSKPIYIAINGDIYDVSASPHYYGPEGGYKFFAGRDAARAYITGCFETHLTHDLRGLNEAQIKSLDTWTDFYANSDKYFKVGRVVHDPIDPSSPIPEDCNAPPP